MNIIQCNGYTLEVVKVKGGWAQKAVVNGIARYRGYRYKSEAVYGLREWDLSHYDSAGDFSRDFYHNFHSAKELGLVEVS